MSSVFVKLIEPMYPMKIYNFFCLTSKIIDNLISNLEFLQVKNNSFFTIVSKCFYKDLLLILSITNFVNSSSLTVVVPCSPYLR